MERKFNVVNTTANKIKEIIRENSFLFTPIYSSRHINNIYFDTPNYDCYYDNLSGLPNRYKIRIRWYENKFGLIKKPILEIKRKFGLVGYKKSYSLNSFNFSKNINKTELTKIFQNSKIPSNLKSHLKSYQPVLYNNYTRKYYLSGDKKFRITVDTRLSFYPINSINIFLKRIMDENNIILELKYQLADSHKAHLISSQFPFRLSKSSKYVKGIILLYSI